MSVPASATLEDLERAEQQVRRLVAHVGPEDAGLATPCSEFDVRALINHLTASLGELPATWAVGQHTGNLVVHAWDIAVPTGQLAELDPELASVALAWGRQNLKPQFRGKAFGPEVPVSEDAPIYARLAGFFGRTPG